MGAMMGFLMGYYLGLKDGPEKRAELQEAWRTIRTSDETKALLAGGTSLLRDLARQGGAMVAGRIADSEGQFSRAA